MRVDNGGHIELLGYLPDQVVNHNSGFRIKTGVGFIT